MATKLRSTTILNLRRCQRIVDDVSRKASTCHGAELLSTLLQLLSCLESRQLSAKDVSALRHRIWQCDLIHVIIEVLREDYSGVVEGWKMLTNLSVTLSSILAGLTPKYPKGEEHNLSPRNRAHLEQVQEFYDIILPTAADSILILANNLLETVETSQDNNDRSTNFVECFRKIVESLLWLCGTHKTCIPRALQSPYLLRLLISDHELYSHIVLAAMETLILTDNSSLLSLPRSILNSFLDELVFKLSGEESTGAMLALRLLAQFSLIVSDLVDSLVGTYSELLSLVRKWTHDAQDLGPAEKYLISQLEARAKGLEERTEQEQAALLIQAAWKGYSSRKKIQRMQRGVRKFQQLYRRRRAEKLKLKEAEKKATLRTSMKQTRLLSSQLAFHEKQLSLYEQLPAGELEGFIRRQEEEAAVRIQSTWKGWRTRLKCKQLKVESEMNKSAAVIQRAFRHHMQKRRGTDLVMESLPPITGAERERLQEEISRYRDGTAPPFLTSEELSARYQQVQEEYIKFYFSHDAQRRKMEQVQLLIAKLDRHCELLLSAPSLDKSLTCADIRENYSSSSPEIAKMARQAHREELVAMNTPWWKRSPLDNNEELSL